MDLSVHPSELTSDVDKQLAGGDCHKLLACQPIISVTVTGHGIHMEAVEKAMSRMTVVRHLAIQFLVIAFYYAAHNN